jgi:MFS family permease
LSVAGTLPYAATIFLSSFLLFLVQPIIAKQILPWFGGSAAVWTTCLVFFQSVLLAGYAYADWTTRLGPRRQAALHVGLLAASLLCLPILASSGWKPQGDEEPILRILLLLGATIGLPYFLLSTTTPLLQAWYWRRFHSAVPYRLFALSNLASLLALLGFPVLFEPALDLKTLGWAWSFLFGGFAILCAMTAWLSMNGFADQKARPATAPVPWKNQLQWLALAAMGSVMLLAVTNHITQNISSVPFLWVLPLALYLVSFILAFDHPRWYIRPAFIGALVVLVPLMAYAVPSLDLQLAAPLYLVGLFVACMVCHGELARLKPDPAHLTRFYLMISLGGALGAVLVAIVAPLALAGYFELGIALVALGAILVLRRKPRAIAT